MKTKIERLLYGGRNPASKCHIVNIIDTEYIYIADYANYNNGNVIITSNKPEISAVTLDNSLSRIEVYYDAFLNNAFKISRSKCESQCECVLFPSEMKEENWILFIETKYTDNRNNALRYPLQATDQIGKTALFFRNKGIISSDKIVIGIISFPKIAGPFDNMYWTTDSSALLKKTEYARVHNIHIEISNTVTLESPHELTIP
ncbi:hypothetical protein IR148_09205 [Dysgonomonas mossii]|uniref:Uncharacterized protein n=1 Tax=Dysgonomonas mossii TaxID=163665 RepID=A0A4Y9IR27_9BACT|nr:hypothetical protein [Dysgonomonas mossii]MBF0761219.1 hypothetical protein [Dysgonomonas mossii]TFU90174.1 hypothetical protein E4T88_09200 [Dysgonomonas mossii]